MRGKIYGKVRTLVAFLYCDNIITTKLNKYFVDMVETEERRLKEREEAMQEQEKDIKADKVRHKKNHHHHHHHPEEKKSGTHDQDETNQNQSSK